MLAASFIAVLAHLLVMRAQSGTHYPPYSTFRADPLGTRAFYETLRAMPGIRAERSLAPIRTLGALRDATCLFLGDRPANRLPEHVFDAVEEIPSRGGRLVFAFAPEARESFWLQMEREAEEARKRQAPKEDDDETDASQQEEAGIADEKAEETSVEPPDEPGKPQGLEETSEKEEAPEPETEDVEDDEEAEEDEWMRAYARWVSLQERWGVAIGYKSLEPDGAGGYVPLTAERLAEDAPLPEHVAWHSAMHFTDLSPAWRTIYAVEDRPVAIERDFGTGTIVFISDSFPFSNEALRHTRHPELLAWVIGENRHVVFDETHLGIQEVSGVMVLARQYRMHGLFLGMLVLALLYVWQSACPLTPRYEARNEGGVVTQAPGRDAVSGLGNLLKRSIPQREVLHVCLDEWKQAFGRSPRSAEKLTEAEAIAARAANAPLMGSELPEAYRQISRVLSKRRQ